MVSKYRVHLPGNFDEGWSFSLNMENTSLSPRTSFDKLCLIPKLFIVTVDGLILHEICSYC